jgi:membrane protease YdiL (CAAX protease family)
MTPFLLLTLVEWMGVIAVTLLLGLSPSLRNRRPVKFVYARREVIVSLGLFAAILLLAFVLYATVYNGPNAPRVPAPQAFEASPLIYTPDHLLQQIGLALIMAFPFFVALQVRRQPWLSVGLNRLTLRGGLQMGLALALITVFLTNRTYTIINGGVDLPRVYYLVGMLAAAFAAEFIFRGYLQLRLQNWFGETWGWVIQAGLFSLWHLPQKLFVEHADPTALLISLGYLFLFGLLLGWIMRKSGNILAPALYHAIHNWMMVL